MSDTPAMLRKAADEMANLRVALMSIRARARFELKNPTELRDTAFSLIEKDCDEALNQK